MLTAISDGVKVVASRSLDKTLSFVCPLCNTTVILKRGSIKIPHFSHKVKNDCDFGIGETEYHRAAKNWLFNYFTNAGYSPDLEHLGIPGVRPDVFVNVNSYSSIAFEVQHSGISIEEINRRNKIYEDNNVAVMWLLTSDVFDLIQEPEFRLKEQNIYLYHQYFNNLYVFTGSDIAYFKVVNASRYVEPSHNCCGEEVGGYYKTLAKTFELDCCKILDLINDCRLFHKKEYKQFPSAFLFGITKYGGSILVRK